jgi:hypothetical protein
LEDADSATHTHNAVTKKSLTQFKQRGKYGATGMVDWGVQGDTQQSQSNIARLRKALPSFSLFLFLFVSAHRS